MMMTRDTSSTNRATKIAERSAFALTKDFLNHPTVHLVGRGRDKRTFVRLPNPSIWSGLTKIHPTVPSLYNANPFTRRFANIFGIPTTRLLGIYNIWLSAKDKRNEKYLNTFRIFF